MSPPRAKPSSKDRKARPGGCMTIAAQRARIARKKGGGGKSPAGIVSELLFEHGMLAAIMAVTQIMAAVAQSAVGVLVGLIAGIGRGAPGAFQSARPIPAVEPVAFGAVQAVGAKRRPSPPKPHAAAGSAGSGPATAVRPSQPSAAYEMKGQAHRETRQDALARFGNEEVYEYIAQSLEYNLEPPIDKYVKGIPVALEKVSPEVARLVSRHSNHAMSPHFKAAKSLLRAWARANPGYSSACGARVLFGDFMELQRVWEDAHRPDPTKGPTMSGPENDGDEGSAGRSLKSHDDVPVPTPFKM